MSQLEEYIDGVPNICGEEERIAAATAADQPVFLPDSTIDFGSLQSAFSIALHMQQPLIPAGGDDLQTAEIISNLQYMMEHQGEGDNHNASVFHWCYKRIGELVPELVQQGKQPRVMLDYAGCLFHGLRKMGLNDVFDTLRTVTVEPQYRHCVEWLGCTWGHAVAPSTPVQDFRLHVRAWQQHFAAIFGDEALSRVRGFSPAEMALPNHPDIAYEFVHTLKDCGYQWVMVQEHTVEQPEDGHSPHRPHLPHLLTATNSAGETATIVAIVKTQGSDTKLVAQMQPYYEAKSLEKMELAGRNIPPLVTQIGDGENGGVMMNEFPGMFQQAMGESSGTRTPAINATEYLEHLFATGITEADLPKLQPIKQKMLWERFTPGDGPEKMEKAIEDVKKEDGSFHMEGGSWTNNISWVEGYDNVLGPMEKISALFARKTEGISPSDPRYRSALFHMLSSQTSCYRYWGQGRWTDYGQEICRRAEAVLNNDL